MKVFFGAAIQGTKKRGERAAVYAGIIETIKDSGHTVVSEHTATESKQEVARLLEQSIGPLPPVGLARRIYVRNKMIELVESDIGAAIFEVSSPSLGTGVEIAHAYLRERMGLPEIPILALYQKDFWPNDLSSMISGLTPEVAPNFQLVIYADLNEAQAAIRKFVSLKSLSH